MIGGRARPTAPRGGAERAGVHAAAGRAERRSRADRSSRATLAVAAFAAAALMIAALAACGSDRAAVADAGPPGADAAHADAALPDASPIDATPADAAGLDAAIVDAAPFDASPGIDPLPDPARVGGPLTLEAEVYGDQPFFTRPPGLIPDIDIPPGFSQGEQFFRVPWVVAPSPLQGLVDGLGPLFHASSCLACHPRAGRAPSLADGGAIGVGILFRLARPGGGAWERDPGYGGQFQPLGVASIRGEGTASWTAEPGVSPASPRPVFSLAPDTDAYGPLDPATAWGARLSPQLAGMGLLSKVPDDAILAWADPADEDGDGVSGRAARLVQGGRQVIGRFGWKAIHATLRDQAAGAFAGDIGITSPDRPVDDCSPIQADCLAAPSGGREEIDGAGLDAVVRFLNYTGIPAARRSNDDPAMGAGNAAFQRIGCAACHRPTLTTGDIPGEPVLSRVAFHPYTDLLLHDMGPGLADAIGEGDAAPIEWRTPPLWGAGLVEAAPGARFLHDGRAADLADAIRWHGGEAESARQAFEALTDDERDHLLAFLRSL